MKSTCWVFILCGAQLATAAEQVLDPALHHLRAGHNREWSEFPAKPEAAEWVVKFQSHKNVRQQTLRLRQQDVKQTWRIFLNGNQLGRLIRNENDMVRYFPVPAGILRTGENTLTIVQNGTKPDDVRVGEIAIDERSKQDVLNESSVTVTVVDAGTSQPTPCRITVLDSHGALHTVGAESSDTLTVRPGVIYTADGRAAFGLPAGWYTIFAGRGFEYGIDSQKITLKPGDAADAKLSIRREVPTGGWVSCDTHVHTLTFSGHGDASIAERLITVAGEGIELPIATDHNVHIDYDPLARKLRVRKHFTPVIGNEVTTRIGHFNIFPVRAGAKIPDYRLNDWKAILDDIYATPNVKVAILNHARDAHSGVTPFGPKLHNAVIGENLEGWQLQANAMELINSGAQQTDVMQMYRDWFGMLNRGRFLTPVGSSDSHDVARHFIGQARTYIRCRDNDPGKIDVEQAVANFVAGKVMVSCGLLAEIAVNRKYGPGELVRFADESQAEIEIAVRVLGPSWTQADRVVLYANGHKIRKSVFTADSKPGVKKTVHWKIPRPTHDVHLVAVASGPGVRALYWPIAKPYQPRSPDWTPRCVGSSGAVWIDADGDGRRTSAFDYATRIVKQADYQLPSALKNLANYDEAVAAQTAGLLHRRGVSLQDKAARAKLAASAPQVRRGFLTFLAAWRENEIARSRG